MTLNTFGQVMLFIVVITGCFMAVLITYAATVEFLDFEPITIQNIQVDRNYLTENTYIQNETYNILYAPEKIINNTQIVNPNLKVVGTGELLCAGTECRMFYD